MTTPSLPDWNGTHTFQLFHLQRLSGVDYDDVAELVVIAHSPEHARRVAMAVVTEREQAAWLDRERSTVAVLGPAYHPATVRVVVCNIFGG